MYQFSESQTNRGCHHYCAEAFSSVSIEGVIDSVEICWGKQTLPAKSSAGNKWNKNFWGIDCCWSWSKTNDAKTIYCLCSPQQDNRVLCNLYYSCSCFLKSIAWLVWCGSWSLCCCEYFSLSFVGGKLKIDQNEAYYLPFLPWSDWEFETVERKSNSHKHASNVCTHFAWIQNWKVLFFQLVLETMIVKRYIKRHLPNSLLRWKNQEGIHNSLGCSHPISYKFHIRSKFKNRKFDHLPKRERRAFTWHIHFQDNTSNLKRNNSWTLPFSKADNVLVTFNDILSAIQSDLPSTPVPVHPNQDKPFLFCFGRAITWFSSQKDESEEACTEGWSFLKEISVKKG